MFEIEMSGETCSIMSQFANRPTSFHKPKENNLFWLEVDDADYFDRHYVAVCFLLSYFEII